MRQHNWECLLCGMKGSLECDTADVWYLMHLIEQAHVRANPECDSILGLFPDDGRKDVVAGQYKT